MIKRPVLGFIFGGRFCTKHLLRINRLINRMRIAPPLSGPGVRSRMGPSILLVGDRTPGPRPVEQLLSQTAAASKACSVLETVTYPHAVPVKEAWSCRSMPQLVSGSGEEQNRIKATVCKRSGTDDQSKLLAAKSGIAPTGVVLPHDAASSLSGADTCSL